MAPFEKIDIELSVVVGEVSMPLQHFLKMERGGFIPLGRDPGAPLAVLANGARVAEGKVEIVGEKVALAVTAGPVEA
jgi:flagellar motor switch/type III secretory pathway protein FliN